MEAQRKYTFQRTKFFKKMQKRDLYYERIPTKLLRENVRYLGNILGKVLKDQEGEKFFELVEKVRKLSKANKTNLNNKLSYRKIIQTIKDLSPKNTLKITRAFTHFMNLINLAESIDASRSLNEYENNKKKINLQFDYRFNAIRFSFKPFAIHQIALDHHNNYEHLIYRTHSNW
mgnify:CR=1 FL=1